MDSPDRRPCILVGGRRHGTGIQYNDFRLYGIIGAQQAFLKQLPLESRAVRLCGPASEIFQIETSHGYNYTGVGTKPRWLRG
jgi:hypothetical protein